MDTEHALAQIEFAAVCSIVNRTMKIGLALLSLILVGVGCTSPYYRLDPISRTAPLRADASALVAVPRDGADRLDSYEGTGKRIAHAVSKVLSNQLQRVEVMSRFEPQQKACLEAARARRFDYLVTPTISQWTERENDPSSRPESIKLFLTAYDVRSGAKAAFVEISAESTWLTLHGDELEKMLAPPLTKSVTWFFSPAGTPAPVGLGK